MPNTPSNPLERRVADRRKNIDRREKARFESANPNRRSGLSRRLRG